MAQGGTRRHKEAKRTLEWENEEKEAEKRRERWRGEEEDGCIRINANIATIQGRSKQSCLTWSGITIRKIPPHHSPTTSCPFTIQSY